MPTSYWVYGVVGGLAWSIAISAMHLTPGSTLAKVTLLSMLVYMIAANVGIWRAANRYQGRKAWVSLSKAAVLFVPLILAISVVAAYFA